MSSSEPLAGIIVPCFNQGHFAAQCIESIRAQTCRNWRVVIVDDASTDGSAAHLAALAGNGVEIVTLTENVGLPAARNVALKRLDDVDYVLTIDCDDWVSPDYLERLVAAIHSDPRVGLAHPTLKLFGVPHPLGIETWPASELVYEERYVENRVPGCSIMRASILRRLGGWNDAFRHSGAADWDLWLRIVESGWRLVWVRDAIYHYRQHAESMVATTSERKRLAQHRNLLRFHASQIAASFGTERFLSQRLMPGLYEAVHARRWREACALFATLLRRAPFVTLRMTAAHYRGRLRHR